MASHHPHGVLPEGNRYLVRPEEARAADSMRREGLGTLSALNDESLLRVLEELDAPALARAVGRLQAAGWYVEIAQVQQRSEPLHEDQPVSSALFKLGACTHPYTTGVSSHAMRALCCHEDLWKTLVLNERGGRFVYDKSWRGRCKLDQVS